MLIQLLPEIQKTTLPQRLAGKAESFDMMRNQLAEAVVALERTVIPENEENLKEFFEIAAHPVHSKHLSLETIVE
jgi:hypothetical protein